MFIREVVKKNKGYEKNFISHLLVESYRTAKGPRQRTVLHLGQLELPRDQWKALANRIEDLISGQKSFVEVPTEVEQLAQHYAQLLINKRLETTSLSEDLRDDVRKEDEDSSYETIKVNSVSTCHCRSVGAEWVSLAMLERLGFSLFFQELGLSEKQVKVAKLLIVGRMVHPSSEWETFRWARHQSAIGELLGLNMASVSHNALYQVGDLLYSHKEKLETFLPAQEADLFSFSTHLVLYDLTNTYFEGRVGSSALKRYGRSKEKRTDCPLVTLGLALNEYGFPQFSDVFSGNVSEPETLKEVLEKLSSRVGITRQSLSPQTTSRIKPVTVILDAGIATEANLKLLLNLGYEYVVVSRSAPPDGLLAGEGFVSIRQTQENYVEARLYRQGAESWLLCHSLQRQHKEMSIRGLLQQRFETDLQAIAAALHKKGGTKRYSKVMERIGRLNEKHKRVAHFYMIDVTDKDGYVINISWRIREQKEFDDRFSGTYFLRTSRTDLDEQQIWHLYIMLTDVEESFLSMKSELGLRPNYHQKDDRIKSHLFVTVLAHHPVQCIQFYLHQKECYMRWKTIRQWLSTQQRVTTSFETKDGRKLYLRNTSEPETFNLFVSKALKIKAKPLSTKKVKI